MERAWLSKIVTLEIGSQTGYSNSTTNTKNRQKTGSVHNNDDLNHRDSNSDMMVVLTNSGDTHKVAN